MLLIADTRMVVSAKLLSHVLYCGYKSGTLMNPYPKKIENVSQLIS
jgi:hypothetical protein